MSHVLADHGLVNLTPVAVLAAGAGAAAAAGRARGARPRERVRDRRRRGHQRAGHSRRPPGAPAPRAASARRISSPRSTSLAAGDLVVHVDHGIGRFVGLHAIEAAGAPHDCLEIHYAGGDKLFLPVENIELLSRYGSEETGVELDRLGGGAWQARKARMKKRIREMAGELIKIAAERAVARGAAARRRAGPLRRILRRLSLRGDRRPAGRHRRGARAISPPAGRWTGWSAATSASARPRWRCAPPSSPR